MNSKKVKKSTVYLIGAGPGDPELITLKGKEILYQCDTVIYDQLVSVDLIFSLAMNVEKHYVGKKAGQHTLTQDQINALMVKCAKQGKSVARLKGGDPFLFGRGAEEAKFLKKYKIDYEVIPGITAGLGASAYAGISCTDRNKSSFTIFATGHKAKSETARVPWELLAKVKNGTIVIYMVVSKLNEIIKEFINNGMSVKTPAAIIERGTSPSQRIITSDLKNIYNKAKENNIQAPAILIIGSVVADQKEIYWIKKNSLFGKRILLLEQKEEIPDLYNELKNTGAEIATYPTLSYQETQITDQINKLMKNKIKDHWLIFKDKYEFNSFINQFIQLNKDIRKLSNFKIAAGGKLTIHALEKMFIQPEFKSKSYDLNTIISELSLVSDLKNSHTTIINNHSPFPKQNPKFSFKIDILNSLSIKYYKWPDGLKEKLLEYLPDFIITNNPLFINGLYKNLNSNELKKIQSHASLICASDDPYERYQKSFKPTPRTSPAEKLSKIFKKHH